jgi:glycosyltransferase involved in cell wall biosynthesis
VVATAVGGTPDLVQEGVTGHLVPPDDEQALADAMVRAFGSPDNSARQGEAGRQHAVRRFAIGAMVQRYQQLFEGEGAA